MFKIYVDDRLITIASSQVPLKNANLVLKLNGSEKKGELSKLIKSFIEEIQLPSLSLISDAPDKTWETFCSLYRILEAAGGVVFNKEKQLLMIYRNEHWDLPKGKIEINENHAEAAIREVIEETGIKHVTIQHESKTTYHIYPYKNDHILKCTYWFIMHTVDVSPLQPQLEEGITKAVWMNNKEITEAINHCYASIIHLLDSEGIIKGI